MEGSAYPVPLSITTTSFCIIFQVDVFKSRYLLLVHYFVPFIYIARASHIHLICILNKWRCVLCIVLKTNYPGRVWEMAFVRRGRGISREETFLW